MLYEKADYHYVSSISAGLPIVLSAWFAVSEPNFWVKWSCYDSFIHDQLSLDGKVLAILWVLFGDFVLNPQVILAVLLEWVDLACFMHHIENLQKVRNCDSLSMHLAVVYTWNEISEFSD